MLFRVDIVTGDISCFDVALDGILFDPRFPTAKTGFKLVADRVEYSPGIIPVGWWNAMKHNGKTSHPLEQVLAQGDGYCDNVFWTREERLAKIVASACTVAKEHAFRGRWPF